MKKYLFALLLIAGCTAQLAPRHNDNSLQGIEQVAKTADSVYTAMRASIDKSFATWEPYYTELQVRISTILLVDQLRQKPMVLLSQVQLLQNHFNYYVDQHRAKGVINNALIQTYQNDVAAFCAPIIISETNFK